MSRPDDDGRPSGGGDRGARVAGDVRERHGSDDPAARSDVIKELGERRGREIVALVARRTGVDEPTASAVVRDVLRIVVAAILEQQLADGPTPKEIH